MTTIYDKLITRVKNNKFIAISMIAMLTVSALFAFYESASKFYQSMFTREFTPPKIRTSFHFIRGHGLSLFLNGSLDKALQEHLGGKPIIWKNPVYNRLELLQTRYARIFDVGAGYAVDENYNSLEGVLDQRLLPSTFHFYKDNSYVYRGGKIVGGAYHSHGEVPDNSTFPINLNVGWNITLTNNPNDTDSLAKVTRLLSQGILPAENVIFRRTLTRDEAAGMFDVDDKFYQDITEHGYPENFFNAEMSFAGCGEYWKLDVRTPLLALQILAVENISEKPIEIDRIVGSLSLPSGIVGNEELQISEQFSLKLGDGILKPEERLIVPIGLFYEFKRDRVTESEYEDWQRPLRISVEEFTQLTHGLDSVTIAPTEQWADSYCTAAADCESENKVEMPIDTVIRALNQEPKPKAERYYLASAKVESVVVNGQGQNLRSAVDTTIFISHGSAAGSCPYLFTASGEPIGKILTGRDSISDEGVYTKRLNTIYGGFTIKELEEETTHIQWVRLACSREGEPVRYLEPIESLLRRDNPSYLVLSKGASFDIHFPSQEGFKRCSLQVSGYYSPTAPSNRDRELLK